MMNVTFNTTDPAKLASMPIPEFVEDVAALDKPADATADKPAEGEAAKPEAATPAVPAEQAVKDAPAGVAKEDLEALIAAETEGEAGKKGDDKEHNFAVMRAANKRLERERDDALHLANELRAKDAPKLDAPPDLAALDTQIAALREEAKRLEEEYPDMGLGKAATINADILTGMRSRIARDELVLQTAREAEQKRVVDSAQDEADAAIEANPVLTHWRDNDQASFIEAARQDAILREQPEWADVPYADRFAAVIALVKIKNPAAKLPEVKADPAADPKPPLKQDEKGAGAPPVRSLSDIPGGILPAKNGLENVAELSPAVLGNKLMTMTRDQQDEWLAGLAI